ncbi:hypothetical protein THAOC_04932 [Thalassiosira oceanica]|uniref:Uncharacterized protein n=1 Tax=Thalassiosira oceanica TaxID=159749 RepID=K0T410_THAOC|nr:hypothetical protein THAOC_04932 [Thalassiosira oceanica]|eukprot:EJK73443.1 hypothetical protein THAOC_04932 [Thalassiosira oceanica]
MREDDSYAYLHSPQKAASASRAPLLHVDLPKTGGPLHAGKEGLQRARCKRKDYCRSGSGTGGLWFGAVILSVSDPNPIVAKVFCGTNTLTDTDA